MAEIKDPSDIADVYLAYKKLLFAIAQTYLQDQYEITNLVEDVIIKLLERDLVFPNEAACLAYMKTIIRNGAINLTRKKHEKKKKLSIGKT